jgi:hypothetical protein
MKIYLDNQLIRSLPNGDMFEDPSQIHFSWSSLLECLDLGLLFESLPNFDSQNELYVHILSTLSLDFDKENLFKLYDQVFVECLNLIKALEPVRPDFLIEKIREKRSKLSLFSNPLNQFENLLTIHPKASMHDLILYLAWDRICVYLAIVFESAPADVNTQRGLQVLKECLIESFHHISATGKTRPGFFRFSEAIYAFLMREEHLQTYSDPDWMILCQSSQALRNRNELPNVPYIDEGIFSSHHMSKPFIKVFTLDSLDKVTVSKTFSNYLLQKCREEMPLWDYLLFPVEIIHVKENLIS